jgi:CspA family cold shock protein
MSAMITIEEEDMPDGTVKWFNLDRGFGLIAPSGGGSDAFVRNGAVERFGLNTLREDQRSEGRV